MTPGSYGASPRWVAEACQSNEAELKRMARITAKMARIRTTQEILDILAFILAILLGSAPSDAKFAA